MTAPVLERLHVLVTGVGAAIARDVVRLVVSEGATVVAADPDTGKLARLYHDVGLCRTRVETASIDLASESQLRTWEMSLSAHGRTPQLMVCCCGSPASPPAVGKGARRPSRPADISLGAHPGRHCPGRIAQRVLQPTIFLHAEPLRRSVFDRAVAVLRHPTLLGVLERGPGRGVPSLDGAIPYVRTEAPTPAPGRRLHLVPPSEPAPNTAEAA
jgi:NAD(P)-dependent dehydrogenase (short-subunit alcohol dehydrogenase family)